MKKTDQHVHTVFSDGNNTAEEMTEAAIRLGLDCIGFTDHANTSFDERWCMTRSREPVYRQTIRALKEKYRDRIEIRCGVEQDFYSGTGTEEYDYAIGSVHYVKAGEQYLPVDESSELFMRNVETCFGGDYIRFAEAYFDTIARFSERPDISWIGHFDIITKFNEADRLFSTSDPRYTAAWKNAADRLIAAGKPFEINTGAISRGYRTEPYPSRRIADYILKKGGRLFLASDSHSTDTLCYEFAKWQNWLPEDQRTNW